MSTSVQIRSKHRNRLPPVLFLLLCALIFAGLDRLPEPSYAWINEANARLTAILLHLFGYDPRVNGTFLTLEGFTVQVIGECSAIFISVLLVAFVLSSPGRWPKKAAGLIAGCLLLLIVNILRIAGVTWVGAFYPQAFEISHVYLGQIVLVVTLLTFCLAWRQWPRRRDDMPLFKNALLLFGWSLVLFVGWLLIHKYYYLLLLKIADSILGIFHLSVQIPSRIMIFPHTFVTFTSVIVGSLFCTNYTKLKRPVSVILIWALTLFLLHLSLFLLQHAFFATQERWTFVLANISLKVNEWLIPFAAFYFFMLRKVK